MPYQGGYVPEYDYNGASGQYGRARHGFQQQQQQQQQSQQQQQTYPPTWHTAYSGPQYFDPSQSQASYYQTPTDPSVQQQQQQQQHYLSPPPQPSLLQQNVQYSPDPLHRYQQPPQPRQTQHQPFYSQQQTNQAPHRFSQSSHASQPSQPQSSHRQPTGPSQWPQYPSTSPYESSGPFSGASTPSQAYMMAPQQPQQSQRGHVNAQNGRSVSQNSRNSQNQVNSPNLHQQQNQAWPAQQGRTPQTQGQRQGPSSQQRPPAARSTPATNSDHRSTGNFGHAMPYSSAQRPPLSNDARPQHSKAYVQSKHPTNPQNDNFTTHPVLPAKSQNTGSTVNSSMLQCQKPESGVQPPRPSVKTEDTRPGSPKRRKSNDGSAVPIYQPTESKPRPVKQEPGLPPSQPTPHVKQTPASSPLTDLTSSQMPPTPTPLPSVDYQSALLALSDEYIGAAYSMTGSLSGKVVSEDLLDQYQNLLSTGLGCLDSVLRNHRIADPRKEARIRLRYASLLYEETENLTDAEECLSKGISLCERARLTDLKYAMHHLTARIWFKSRKFKTAMKTVERLSAEVEKLQLLHWIYAFHFLRVSFGLQVSDNQHETVSLVRYLTALSAVATRHSHVSVQIVAHTLEALVHLRARTSDSVDLATRAMASARMHQLTPEMKSMPQVRALLDYLDVACSLVRFNRKVAEAKVQSMQLQLDQRTDDGAWSNSSGCTLSISLDHNKNGELEADSGGIFQQAANGDISLAFTWLTKQQAYIAGYLISGLSKLDGSSALDAAKFFSQVVTMSKTEPKDLPLSLSAATSRWQLQVSLRATARLYIAFAFCGNSDWSHATTALQTYREKDVQQLESPPDAAFATLATYLDGVVKHGSGDLAEALRLYRSPALQVALNGNAKSDASPLNMVKVLAALNSVEILHSQGKHKEADSLLDWAEPYCVVTRNSDGGEHGSRAMEALFHMLKAVASQRSGGLIIDTKAILQRSVKAAQAVGNEQLLMCVMGIMTDAWFKNIVGQQAVSSGKSARGLAGKNNNKLWRAVGTKMYADTLELSGQLAQAEEMRQDAQQLMAGLPPTLRDSFQGDRTN